MRIVILSIALLFCAFSAHSQVLKSAGVWYFLDVDSMTARPAVMPNGTELAYVVGTKTVYYWNRNTSTWTAYGSTFNRDSIYFDSSIIGSGTVGDPWRVDSTLFATIAGVGDSIANALLGYLPLEGGSLTGTGGAGFIGFPSQISAPGTPASGLNVYAQGSSFNWKGTDGYERQFASTLTGGRTYTLPNVSGTFALGTGTATRIPIWTSANVLGDSPILYNSTTKRTTWDSPGIIELPMGTDAQRPTATTSDFWYNTTGNGVEWYNGTRWAKGVEGTFNRGTALFFPNFDANGQIQNSLMFQQSDGDIFSGSGVTDGGQAMNFKLSGSGYRTILFDGSSSSVQPILTLKGGGPFLTMQNNSGSEHLAIGMGTYTGGRGIEVIFRTGTAASTADRIQFSANGTAAMNISSAGISFGSFTPVYALDMFGKTGGFRAPLGTTVQRPTGAQGVVRMNTDTLFWELHDGTDWRSFASRAWVRSNFARSSSLTTNRLPKWNGSSLVNSSWEDDGTQLLALNNLPVRAKDIETNSGVIELSAGFGAPAIRSRSSSPSTSDNNGLQIIAEDAGAIIFTLGKKNNSGFVEPVRMDSTGLKYKQNFGAIPGRAAVLAYSTYFAGSSADTLITGTYQFSQDRTFQILGDGTGIFPKIVGRGYGTGTKEAADLSKTQSNYIAGFATDGTVLDLERKRDTTIFVTADTDYDFSAAVTTAQISRRYNRIIIHMTLTSGVGADKTTTLHAPDANLMQCEILIRGTDNTGTYDNEINFGTNNAISSDGTNASGYTLAQGQGLHVRVVYNGSAYKYIYY